MFCIKCINRDQVQNTVCIIRFFQIMYRFQKCLVEINHIKPKKKYNNQWSTKNSKKEEIAVNNNNNYKYKNNKKLKGQVQCFI